MLQALPAAVYARSADAVVRDYLQACTPASAMPSHAREGVLVAHAMLEDAPPDLRQRILACMHPDGEEGDSEAGTAASREAPSHLPSSAQPSTAPAKSWTQTKWVWIAVALVVVVGVVWYMRRGGRGARASAQPPSGAAPSSTGFAVAAPRAAAAVHDETSWYTRDAPVDAASAHSAASGRVLPPLRFEE